MMARIAEADTEGRRLARRRAEMGDMLMRAADAFERADMVTVQESLGLAPGIAATEVFNSTTTIEAPLIVATTEFSSTAISDVFLPPPSLIGENRSTPTQFLRTVDDLFTAGQLVNSVYRAVAIVKGGFDVQYGLGPALLVINEGIINVGAGVPWARVVGSKAAKWAARVPNVAFVSGPDSIALQLARLARPSGLQQGLPAAGEAVKSWGTVIGLVTTWGLNIYDYTWGDNANASRTEFAAAMTVDTAALLTSTALGGFVGGCIGGPPGALVGAALGGGLYLGYSFFLREGAIQWTDENVITPLWEAWSTAPNPNFLSGYSYP